MKILTPGHRYELANHENPEQPGQVLQFIEKRPEDIFANAPLMIGATGKFITVNNGTTNEEVLRMLIDRMASMQAKLPCRENALVITKLEESLMWLDKRTKDRLARGVENTPKA